MAKAEICFLSITIFYLQNVIAQENCGKFPNNTHTYMGRFFRNKFIDDSSAMETHPLEAVFPCNRLCTNSSGCVAVDFNNNTKECRLFDLTTINIYIKEKRNSQVIVNLPMDCDVEHIVHGIWGEWYNASNCTSVCGHGTMIRKRECKEPVCNGNPCRGSSERTIECGISTCLAILQKRFDGSVSFQRNWEEYKNGFGDPNGEFWFGLENAYALMRNRNITLRFDMWNGEEHAYMEYFEATIANETEYYTLNYNGFSGTGGDSLTSHSKGMQFSTRDKDNDKHSTNCSTKHGGGGGWWFKSCKDANFNGLFGMDQSNGILWRTFTLGIDISLSKTEIKIIVITS